MNDLTKDDVKKTPFPGITVTGNGVVIAGDSVSIKENKKCKHEWYGGECYGDSAERKCNKCGEFYI